MCPIDTVDFVVVDVVFANSLLHKLKQKKEIDKERLAQIDYQINDSEYYLRVKIANESCAQFRYSSHTLIAVSTAVL